MRTATTAFCALPARAGYRGYWNYNTGKLEIPANHYVKAWIFSEGLAAVMEPDSTLRFINPMGEVVIDKQFRYAPMADNRGVPLQERLLSYVQEGQVVGSD